MHVFRAAVLLFVVTSFATAHEISGSVQVLLKGEKKKTDLSSVIVYLSRPGGRVPTASAKQPFTIATKNKQLKPQTLVVPAGATVTFPNYDPIFHNLFSVSTPNQFDLGLYKGGQTRSRTFTAPGVVKVFCNVHPQMAATIVVSDTPYFTTANTSGNFSLGVIPNGTYTLVALSDEGQTGQKIEVGDQPLTFNLMIDGSKYKKLRHKNKFGKDYSADEKY